MGKYQPQATNLQPQDGRIVPWSLTSLLDPVSLDVFGDQHWGREPLYIARGDSGFYDGLIKLADLERYFSLGELFRRHSIQTVSKRFGGEGGARTLGDVSDRMRLGDSLRLRRMECFLDPSTPIVALAREMEAALQHPLASLSCYITPAGAMGLGPHHDETEIFTLQVEGTKHWRLFHRVASAEPALYDRRELGEPSRELTLAPGDLFYMPNGWVHEVTSDEASFSITIVFDPLRWTTLFDALAEQMADRAPFLDTLPIGAVLGSGGQDGLRRRMAACLNVIRAELDTFESSLLVDSLARRLLGRMTPPPGRVVSDMLRLNQLTGRTLVERRPEVACHLVRRDDAIVLMLAGGQVISAPIRAEQAFRAMVGSVGPFRVADIDGTLDDGIKLSLVGSLIGGGLLKWADSYDDC